MADIAITTDIDDDDDEEVTNYADLFEDDIFGGTPVSKYWDIEGQIAEDSKQAAFDDIIERMVVLEDLLSKHQNLDDLDKIVQNYTFTDVERLDQLKQGLYMDLTGKLVYLLPD